MHRNSGRQSCVIGKKVLCHRSRPDAYGDLEMRWDLMLPFLALPCTLLGDDHQDVELARRLAEQGHILPLEQLLLRTQALRAGIPIEVELHPSADQGTYVYEIDILDRAGAVWSLVFDAVTGQLIEFEADGH
jgi:hypothetical protein